jgi:hypothetical protein
VTEFEQVVLLRTLLSYVEEIHKGQGAPGPVGILRRLRRYAQLTATQLQKGG